MDDQNQQPQDPNQLEQPIDQQIQQEVQQEQPAQPEQPVEQVQTETPPVENVTEVVTDPNVLYFRQVRDDLERMVQSLTEFRDQHPEAPAFKTLSTTLSHLEDGRLWLKESMTQLGIA